MASAKSEKTLYPYIVIGMIIGCVVACGFTIKIALDNPVEMDTFYMEKYQKVDHNINQILQLQEEFNARFDIGYSTEKFKIGQNTLTLKLTDKSGNAVDNANITLMLSRPDTNKQNKELKATHGENGLYTFGPFEISKPGRWQILSKIQIGDFQGYHKNEAYSFE